MFMYMLTLCFCTVHVKWYAFPIIISPAASLLVSHHQLHVYTSPSSSLPPSPPSLLPPTSPPGRTVAGTTDSPTELTHLPMPREEDIRFILSEIKAYLSPTISGWRPARVLYIVHCAHLMYMSKIKNHNSLGHKRPLGLDVQQSPNAQDTFQPIPGLISCAGVTGSVGIMYVYMYLTKLHHDYSTCTCALYIYMHVHE